MIALHRNSYTQWKTYKTLKDQKIEIQVLEIEWLFSSTKSISMDFHVDGSIKRESVRKKMKKKKIQKKKVVRLNSLVSSSVFFFCVKKDVTFSMVFYRFGSLPFYLSDIFSFSFLLFTYYIALKSRTVIENRWSTI